MRYSIFERAAVAILFISQIMAAPQGRGSEDDERSLDLPTPGEMASGLGLQSSTILTHTSVVQTLPTATTLAVAIQSASQKPTPAPTTLPTTHKPSSTPNANRKELHREARALAHLSSSSSLAVTMKRAAIWVFESAKTAIS